MMSAPSLIHRSNDITQPAALDMAPPPAPVAPVLTPAKRRFSFLPALPKMGNIGIASWYGSVLNGHKTASGETFDMTQMTACHRTLPFGTMVRVVDLRSHKSVIVRINDRGVLFADRIIDLSVGAAERLGIRSAGVAKVRVDVLNKKQAEQEIASTQASASAISVE